MANYIYISDYAKKGKMAISVDVFNSLANQAIKQIPGISTTKKIDVKKHKVHLHNPVKTTIHHDIVHVGVVVDALKGTDLHATSLEIQTKIREVFMEAAESIPFDVQVKFASII